MYSQEVKNEKTDNDEARKIFKILEDLEGNKINYSKLVYKSGDNEYFDFTKFGPLSSFYLKLVNGNMGVNVAKLSMNEFINEIDRLKKKKKKKANKPSYKTNKKDVLENAEALYNRLNIIVDAFERQVFEYRGRPEIDVDYISGTYDLTDRELQMFKKLFKYDNTDKLRDVLIDADKEEYAELLNDLKIIQTVLKD